MPLLAYVRVEIAHFKEIEGFTRNFKTFIEMQSF